MKICNFGEGNTSYSPLFLITIYACLSYIYIYTLKSYPYNATACFTLHRANIADNLFLIVEFHLGRFGKNNLAYRKNTLKQDKLQ